MSDRVPACICSRAQLARMRHVPSCPYARAIFDPRRRLTHPRPVVIDSKAHHEA